MDRLATDGLAETDQAPYRMFRRGIEDEVLPYAAEHDIGVLVYGPLADHPDLPALTSGTSEPD